MCVCSYLDHDMGNDTYENPDVCSITLDKSPCGVSLLLIVSLFIYFIVFFVCFFLHLICSGVFSILCGQKSV